MSKHTNKKVKPGTTTYLSTLADDYLNLNTKIAMITLGQKNFLRLKDMILLFIEHAHLISQAHLFRFSYDQNKEVNENLLFQGVVFISKLMNLAFWIDFNEQKVLLNILFVIFISLAFLKYIVFSYIIITVKSKMKGQKELVALWQWIFKVQGRVVCFFTTSLFFKILSICSHNNFDIIKIGSTNLTVFSIFIIILEYALSFIFQIQYCYILPSSRFLAQKNNRTKTLTLLQKLLIQILQTAPSQSLLSTRWAFAVINLLFDLLRNIDYFFSIPLYNFKALSYQTGLLMIVTCLHLSIFFELIVYSDINMNFSVMTWIILSVLAVKLSVRYLNQLKITFMNNSTKGSAEFLVHKISIIKHLKELKPVSESQSQKNELPYLLNRTAHHHIKSIFDAGLEPSSSTNLDIECPYDLYLSYLKSLSMKFPRNGFIKLYEAYIEFSEKQHITFCIRKHNTFSFLIWEIIFVDFYKALTNNLVKIILDFSKPC